MKVGSGLCEIAVGGIFSFLISVETRLRPIISPMAARVVNKVGLEANPQNHLIMHAMGPNVSGVIGSAVAAGVLLALL